MSQPREPHKTDIKETLTSVIIAFAMAFLFRGFVVEAFLIPTGSMAPTLRGQHHQWKSPDSGAEWAVGPPDGPSPSGQAGGTVRGFDIATGREMDARFRSRAGDRIFVMKYLYSVYDPQRFDVVVFKNPTDPTQNFIKRLIGLPNEQLALIDGDVFVRTPRAEDAKGVTPWLLPGWKVATKPLRAQQQLWLPVFDSAYSPLSATTGGRPWAPPFLGLVPSGDGPDAGWTITNSGRYAYVGSTPTRLEWDAGRRPIYDNYQYNVHSNPQLDFTLGGPGSVRVPGSTLNAGMPVSDLRLSLGVRPKASGLEASAVVEARRHEFRADIRGTSVELKMRPLPQVGTSQAAWQALGKGSLAKPLPIGKVTNIEFWHVDQTLQLWVDGELVVRGAYDWTPEERVRNVFDRDMQQVLASAATLTKEPDVQRAKARWEFAGAPLELVRVRIDRDIHYRAATYGMNASSARQGRPALATHPSTTLTMNSDQFFVCGDNSPASLDGRLWETPNPWVQWIEPREGIVHRDLLIGKAFFVYFPAPQWPMGVPMPDVGRMRWIW